MITLGLDISTSITGATVIQEEKILETTFWDTRNKNHFPTIYQKARHVKSKLEELTSKYKISHVYIEQSLHSFRSGFSSAQTLSTLSRFNGIISWVCWDLFNIEPEMIAATSARKQAGVGIKRGDNAKEKVLQFIIDKYPNIEIQYTKHGNPKPGTLDMCDSIVIALAGDKLVRETQTT
jgi:Holliday junction resolvasome RuvABC endonuclease subunit